MPDLRSSLRCYLGIAARDLPRYARGAFGGGGGVWGIRNRSERLEPAPDGMAAAVARIRTRLPQVRWVELRDALAKVLGTT